MGHKDRRSTRPYDEQGTALAEWALLVILVALVAFVSVSLAGEEVSGQYSEIASAVERA